MVRDYLALHRYLAERSLLPFGGEREWDCCARFAAGAVAAQTGSDPLARLSESWTTELQAAAIIARAGGLAEATSTVLAECPIGLAQRGDVGFVVADGPVGGALVIVEGPPCRSRCRWRAAPTKGGHGAGLAGWMTSLGLTLIPAR